MIVKNSSEYSLNKVRVGSSPANKRQYLYQGYSKGANLFPLEMARWDASKKLHALA